jgi:hypothetical protein
MVETQKSQKEHFRAILHRYAIGRPLEGDDLADVLALLRRHPEAAQKIGCGIQAIEVQPSIFGTRCFRIVRSDGTETDFSYLSCIRERPNTPAQDFAEACRFAVEGDLAAAKQLHFLRSADADGFCLCEETGQRVSFREAHLDHMPPLTFEVIVSAFLASIPGGLVAGMTTEPRDAQYRPELVDPDLAQRFRAFHRRLARLRILTSGANLANSSRHRLRSPANPVLIPDEAE